MNAYNIMFVVLAVLILCSSIATVVTKSIIRAATYLLFVLLGTAGLYFLLGYTFLGSVQIMVYAGGIIVLYVFSIFAHQWTARTAHQGQSPENHQCSRA